MFSIFTSTATIVNPQLNAAVSSVLSDLLQVVLLGVVSLIGWAVKIWLNSMNSSWKKTVAMRLVSYAEQKIVGNDEKIKYVSQKINEHFPRLGQEEVQHLIEEAVVQLKAQIGATNK
jgi:hypothetical protein